MTTPTIPSWALIMFGWEQVLPEPERCCGPPADRIGGRGDGLLGTSAARPGHCPGVLL